MSPLPVTAVDGRHRRVLSVVQSSGVMSDRRFLSTSQTAELLGLSSATLYRAIRDDQFPAIRVRDRYVIPAKAIDQMEADAMERRGVVDAADYVVVRRDG